MDQALSQGQLRRKREKDRGLVTIPFRVSRECRKRLKAAAVEEECSVQAILTRLADDFLARGQA